ncbi:MAG: hypothetical protein IPO81_12145 [Kouleothrix sp.]|nr:hypothetical protein [Kouleothrix sp.]
MNIATFEGIVEHGKIRLTSNVQLPENAKVYVVVPGMQISQIARIVSPRLANAAQVADFAMEITEGPADAGV